MLPDSTAIRNNSNIAKFADTGIDDLLRRVLEIGADRRRLIAKIAGGAQMFAFYSNSDLVHVGERNVQATRQKLGELRIPIKADETGDSYGRTVIFSRKLENIILKQ